MENLNKEYAFLINGNLVKLEKIYRTRTQYEYYLTIFMGDSDYESIMDYQGCFLTKKAALLCAKYTILKAPKPRVERVL